MLSRAAIFLLAFVCAAGFAGANSAPCPMTDTADTVAVETVTVNTVAADTGHSGGGDCAEHKTQPDCNHTSLADCAGIQATVSAAADGFETANPALQNARRTVFLKTAEEQKAFRHIAAVPRAGPVFLLTQRILV